MPQATVQANARDNDQHDKQDHQPQGQVQGDREQAREQFQQSVQTSEEAISQLVHAYAEAFRSFVPSAWLRPSEAIDFVYDVTAQVLSVQRRFVEELIGAARSNLAAVQNATGTYADNDERANANGNRRSSERAAA